MPKTKPWSELRRKIPDTPESRFVSSERHRAMDVGQALGELEAQGWLIEGEHQDVITIEHEEGHYLGTLRNAVELLDGHLEITAILPEQKVRFVPIDNEAHDAPEGE